MDGNQVHETEQYALFSGSLALANSYWDINYYTFREKGDKPHIVKSTFFVEKESIISVSQGLDEIEAILTVMESVPIYFLSIILQNMKNNSPFDRAVDNNSVRLVSLYLGRLDEIKEFNLSNLIYFHFPDLFTMRLITFESYLATCYF